MMNNNKDVRSHTFFVCPETKQGLSFCPLSEAEHRVADGGKLATRRSGDVKPFGSTPTVLLSEDYTCAYPVFDGIPILLSPERLSAEKDLREFDFSDPRFAEAYEEMTFYNEFASNEAKDIERSEAFESLKPILEKSSEKIISSFPDPKEVWLDAVYDCAAQSGCYKHLSPVKGKRLLQLGGKGTHAVKWLLAGAKEVWLGSPMLGEARFAIALAEAAGVSEGLRCVVLVAEEMPFASDIFDGIYAGGCLHHMVIPSALSECARVLRVGGRFCAAEPWKAPLHTLGTRVFGKRETDVHCRPLTKRRIDSLYKTFRTASIKQHGTLFRYPLLALSKLGIKTSLETAWRINCVDDAICSLVPGLRGFGSSIAVFSEK